MRVRDGGDACRAAAVVATRANEDGRTRTVQSLSEDSSHVCIQPFIPAPRCRLHPAGRVCVGATRGGAVAPRQSGQRAGFIHAGIQACRPQDDGSDGKRPVHGRRRSRFRLAHGAASPGRDRHGAGRAEIRQGPDAAATGEPDRRRAARRDRADGTLAEGARQDAVNRGAGRDAQSAVPAAAHPVSGDSGHVPTRRRRVPATATGGVMDGR
ncbi:hypothetical protein F01_421211 [Burkholderia cenocepacia]|nr:hypothetical protein F01_421211 [Burkholderia cenocepacia]